MDSDSFSSRPIDNDPPKKWPKKLTFLVFLLKGEGERWTLWRIIKILVLSAATLIFLYVGFLWITLPNIDDPQNLIASQSTVIVDRNGTELYRLFKEEDRTYISGEEIPEYMKQAIIAIEDRRFYDHGCFDTRAIIRAAFANIFNFKSQGGSTITQQFARNALLTREKRISRKVKELMLACALERRYDKEKILEMYLNWIPFGQNAYGIEQASQVYFGSSASGLTLAQASVLASLPQRPSYLSPYGSHRYTMISEDVKRAILLGEITTTNDIPDDEIQIGLIGTGSSTLYVGGRSDQVLRNMQKNGFITENMRLKTLEDLRNISFKPSRENIRAPHFVLWIRQQVGHLLEGTQTEDILEQGGLTIETTLDWELQQIAEDVIESKREDIATLYGAQNIALVSVDTKTNEILAYIGNTDYNDNEHGGKIDMARAPRQPGSSFKPIVYARAFQKGYTPATILYDVPTKIGEDEPQNFDGKFTGPLTIRDALGASRNLPAAKAFFLGGGEQSILDLAAQMGAPTPRKRKQELIQERGEDFAYGWPLAIGAAEIPLTEMVNAYATLASRGVYKPLKSIRRITDKHGNLLYEPEVEEEQVLDPRIAYQITSILSDEDARPSPFWKTQLTIPGYETAAKTGTSNKCLERDEETQECLLRKPDNAWLIGFTPNLVAGVWIGNADSTSMLEKAGGLNSASSIWRDFLYRAHKTLENPETTFNPPNDLVKLQISTLSGELPTECTPVKFRRGEVFLKEDPPTLSDPACVRLIVDKLTGLLASDTCPKDTQEERSFLVPRSILPKRFPEWEEAVQVWTQEQTKFWHATPSHSGAVIPLPIAPTEECDPSLTPGRFSKPKFDIAFPGGAELVPYPAFRARINYTGKSPVRDVEYHLDGRVVATGTGAFFSPLIRAPRSVDQDGTHELEIIVTDEYFNTVRHNVKFRFGKDTNGPNVSFILPKNDIQLPLGADLTLRATAEDREGEVKYVQFYIGETLLSTRPKAPYEITYTIDLDPGNYFLRAVARDLAGNETEDRKVLTVKF